MGFHWHRTLREDHAVEKIFGSSTQVVDEVRHVLIRGKSSILINRKQTPSTETEHIWHGAGTAQRSYSMSKVRSGVLEESPHTRGQG